jgi:hypothetical protein
VRVAVVVNVPADVLVAAGVEAPPAFLVLLAELTSLDGSGAAMAARPWFPALAEKPAPWSPVVAAQPQRRWWLVAGQVRSMKPG